LELTFLGTGTSQGIPIIGSDHPVCHSSDIKDNRLRTSAMISWGDYRYIVDCGPDFRAQMLRHEVAKIDGILFTHEHADHTAGIDDIRPFYFRQGSIQVYASAQTVESLKRRFDYIFVSDNKYPGAPGVSINELSKDQPFKIGDKWVTPIVANHNRIDVLGFRIDNLAYFTDVKYITEEELKKLEGVELLVLNALRIEAHHSHLNLEDAVELAQRIGAKQTYFTHISHMLGFHKLVDDQLPDGINLAYDNLKVTI
jgi:phosphoribosyl 1,2-cyclic phosphate phosphodiesterase